MWWQDAVVYQIYPRSFQDSDGDGVGDLRGIERRLDHVSDLGADAVWLSPIYPSPLADFGYDISDHQAVEPAYGTLEDLDALIGAARERGMRLLMDVVPCHTSIEHPWFRERPDYYLWSDRDGPGNNWIAAFGGPAWSRDPRGRGWYLHSYYPEQPDLDWRNPEVVAAMQDVLRFWLDRGVDGFRLDALDRLLKDPEARDDPPATGPPPLPLEPEHATLEHLHSRNAPDIGRAVAALREAAGDAFLAGEVYLTSSGLAPYLEYVDVVFSFELLHAGWSAPAVAAAVEAAVEPPGRPAWVTSNHDFPRLATRAVGRERLAAMLLLTLPGPVFLYQGDEIGMADGPGGDPPRDRFGRDVHRHPMQWDPSPGGGFTTGEPWLPVVDPVRRNVRDQQADPGSLLSLYRELIALRPRLGAFALLDAAADVLAYRRGEHVVALNFAPVPRPGPTAGEIVIETRPGALRDGVLDPYAGAVLRRG